MEQPKRTTKVIGFVGVYDADGGVRGEVSYVVGKMLGTAHCALCDVTHAGVARKRAWDRMVSYFGVPFALLHRNEMPADITRAVSGSGLAIVLARLDDESLEVVLTAEQLEELGGDVAEFQEAVGAALAARIWELAPAR